MNEKITPGPLFGHHPEIKEAVCIQTDKIYDSCRDKDCIENARVYLSGNGQDLVDRAINIKCRKSEIIWVLSDVEAVPFNRGFYTVDLKFFFKITLDVFLGVARPVQVEGLATFDKKVILFGSEGQAKIYSSRFKDDGYDQQGWRQTNLPKAVVEVVDPICLAAKLVELRDINCNGLEPVEIDFGCLPTCVTNAFEDSFPAAAANVSGGVPGERKRVYVTIGLFSIVKLERDIQLLIPAYDFCVPAKECIGSSEEEP